MKKYILIIALIGGIFTAFAQIGRPGKKNKHPMYIQYVSVDDSNSDGVNRVTINIIGVSHTSSRIDSAKVMLHDGGVYAASDIDGVDFGRYFQWEDEGLIPVELDFPRTGAYTAEDTLALYTVHGVYKSPLIPKSL